MKRMIALVLALMMLLASAACCEEYLAEEEGSPASTLELSNLSISVVEDGRSRSARLKDMSLLMSLGSTEGVPTMEATFDNGKGTQIDGVLQIVDSEVLISVGGITGTYSINLEEIAGEQGSGAQAAAGLGKTLMLAGPHLDVILMALATADADGVRTVEVNLPNHMYSAVADAVLDVMEGLEVAEDMDVDQLHQSVENSSNDAVLSVRYKQSTGDIAIAAMQGKRGIQLAATMTLSVAPTVFVNISADEERYDLLKLDSDTLMELRDELEIILMKFGYFAGGSGLSRIFR